ncbi:MAG: class E sortase [Actinobacteria bacterium]|nr:class E sortase [Actinomycetota bacterium]
MSDSMSGSVPSGEPILPESPPPPRRRARSFRWLFARLPEARADRALVVATLTAVLVVGGSTLAIVRHSPDVARASEDAPLLDALQSTTTTMGTTTTTVALPRILPEEPPANPHAVVPVVKIGEIQIPKIGLVHPIYEGVTLTVIDNGPGHWPGSASPGQLGNAVFAGHRVTHSHPFRRINELTPGDEIIFKMANGTFTYKMTSFQIVTPKDVQIVNPTSDATVTLFACHPPGSAIQRYVVHGVFISSTPA